MNLSSQLHRRAADLSTVVSWTCRVPSAFPGSALLIAMLTCLSACGGGDYDDGYGGGPPPQLSSFAGTTGVFAAWADPLSGNYGYAPVGSFAGKRQALRGSIDFLSGQNVSQPAGVEVYKGSDGHIYALDLTTFDTPAAAQISTESAATVDDACSLTGTTAVAGADTDYVGVYFTADLVTTTNSSYIYRLPGPDGVCNTVDDVMHMVKTGMGLTEAPITVSAMPVATVRTSLGGIAGFVIKSGANLVLVDSNFANPTVLGTFSAPIGVAVALPVGTTQGYPTGQLYIVDGNIVYVDYNAHATSAALFAIPQWTPTSEGAIFAASPTDLFFAVNTAATSTVAASATLYELPADGSGPPVAVDNEAGRIAGVQFPVQSPNLIFSVVDDDFLLRSLPSNGGAATTLATIGAANSGSFIATAATVYYTTWVASTNETTGAVTRSGTQSGILTGGGSVLQAPLANSTFVNGGEFLPWPDDTITTQTAYATVFQVTNLSPVTIVDSTTGTQYVDDGVSGGTLTAVDTTSNQPIATIGTLPQGAATYLSGTFRGYDHTGFFEATTAISTQDPATRDLYLLNSQGSASLSRITDDL